MATTRACCGCSLVDDYGTSIAFGEGSTEDPFSISQVDPAFIRPSARIERQVGNQTITLNTPTALIFDTEILDTASIWTVVTPTRLTFPIGGLYLIGSSISANNVIASTIESSFRVNGITTVYNNEVVSEAAAILDYTLHYLYPANALDYVEVVVRTTATRNFNGFTVWALYLGRKV